MHSHVQTEGASVLRSSPLKRCRKCVLLSQYQGSLVFTWCQKWSTNHITVFALCVYVKQNECRIRLSQQGHLKNVRSMDYQYSTRITGIPCHPEALCQPLSGNSFPYTKFFLSLWKIIQMMLIVCGARNSSGDLTVVTAHRRSAFNLVIKVSENSMYGWC